MTLKDLAREMLESTNPYDAETSELRFRIKKQTYDLWEMVSGKLPNNNNRGTRAERCYQSISSALCEYAESYRALSGFFLKDNSNVDWGSVRRLTAYIEKVNRDVVLLPYTLGESSAMLSL